MLNQTSIKLKTGQRIEKVPEVKGECMLVIRRMMDKVQLKSIAKPDMKPAYTRVKNKSADMTTETGRML